MDAFLWLQKKFKLNVLETGCSLPSLVLWAFLRFMQSVSWLTFCLRASEFNTPSTQFRPPLDVSDNTQTVLLTPFLAAQCGYTQKSDPWGNMIVSASLQSCFAEKQVVSLYILSIYQVLVLKLWFICKYEGRKSGCLRRKYIFFKFLITLTQTFLCIFVGWQGN